MRWEFWGTGRVCRSLRSIGGGISSGLREATIGAAKARGEDIDEGVDERVWYVLGGQWYMGTGAGTEDALLVMLSVRSSARDVWGMAETGVGEAEGRGVGSEDAP